MPRVPFKVFYPASGGAPFKENQAKSIRFARYGCTNRPFYHIVVMPITADQNEQPIEQLGTFDPMPNEYNEKLVSLNIERIRYWMGDRNVSITRGVKELLGLSGLFPIYFRTYMKAWRNRSAAEKELEKARTEKLKDEEIQKETTG